MVKGIAVVSARWPAFATITAGSAGGGPSGRPALLDGPGAVSGTLGTMRRGFCAGSRLAENERTVDAREFDQNPGCVMDLAERGPVTVVDERGEVCLRISFPSFDDQ